MMNSFEAFALPKVLADAIALMNYTTPTTIQEKVIPLVLEGRDILASSHTGSGKTGAFSIPLIAKILASESETALILTPTRELATQVMDIVRNLTKNNHAVKTALLIGGDPIDKQYRQLRSSPRIVVGTPGRVNDHLKRSTLKLNNNKYLVLDETDRMLDMGFGIQIDAILKHMPKERQTLLFSATLSKQIEKLSENYLVNPEYVKNGADRAVAPNITQENVNVTEQNKYPTLLKEIESREGSILIFVKTKHSAQNIADRLSDDNQEALAIHGDLKQRQRNQVMKSFHSQKNRIMVATDIASRGLDVPHIEHVINYDPPQMAEDYIHRIGRTARAGRSGSSLNLVSNKDGKKWKEISKLLRGEEPEPFSYSNSNSGGRPQGGRSFGNSNRGGSRPFSQDRSRDNGGFRSNDREKKSWGDRPQRSFDGASSSFGNSSEGSGFRDRKPWGDSPRRSSEGRPSTFGNSGNSSEGNSFRERKPWGDNPRRSSEGRPSGFGRQSEGGGFRERKTWGDSPRRSSEGNTSNFGKPREGFGSRRPEGQTGFRDSSKKPFTGSKFSDKRGFSRRSENGDKVDRRLID